MTTELVTQIVILLTALVGLYKAATYKPHAATGGDSESESEDGGNRSFPDILDALLSFAGIFGFMLLMPAFVWVFTTITSNIGTSSLAEKESVPQYSTTYEIPEKPSPLQLELVAASQIPYESRRGEALEELALRALDACKLRLAIAAASAVPYKSARGETLSSVIKVMHSGECVNRPGFEEAPRPERLEP
jgi:hypothetical protein